jgi:hypothetical protein
MASSYFDEWRAARIHDVVFDPAEQLSANLASAETTIVNHCAAIRGSRENWIMRFNDFCGVSASHNNESVENMFSSTQQVRLIPNLRCTRLTFATRFATILGSSSVDKLDKEALFYLLIGRGVTSTPPLLREYRASSELFHYRDVKDEEACRGRYEWLDAHVIPIEKCSEVFFSQLKVADITAYAERFWDSVVEPMAKNCPHFPHENARRPPEIGDDSLSFSVTADSLAWPSTKADSWDENDDDDDDDDDLHVSGGDDSEQQEPQLKSRRNRAAAAKHTPAMVSSSINWEVYRELVTLGMQRASLEIFARKKRSSLEVVGGAENVAAAMK